MTDFTRERSDQVSHQTPAAPSWPAIITSKGDVRSMLREGGESAAGYFGLVRDGSANTWQALQNLVDYVVYAGDASVPSVAKIPRGRYRLDDVLSLAYGIGFKGLRLQGVRASYDGSDGFGGVAFFPSFTDRPCIAVQGGRQTEIRDLSIISPNAAFYEANFDPNDPAKFYDPAFWTTGIPASSANMDSRYAPYAAIAIDPYSGAAPSPSYPAVTYPAPLGAVGQYNKAPSSETILRRVVARGFIAGCVSQPGDFDANGDFTKLIDCSFTYNKYNLSLGNNQARQTEVRGGQMGACYVSVAGNVHGKQRGRISKLYNVNMDQSAILALLAGTALNGPIEFDSCYGELIGYLGVFAASAESQCAVKFTSSDFLFAHETQGFYPAAVLYSSNVGAVSLDGCRLTGYGSMAQFDAPLLTLTECQFQSAAPATAGEAIAQYCAAGAGIWSKTYARVLNCRGGPPGSGTSLIDERLGMATGGIVSKTLIPQHVRFIGPTQPIGGAIPNRMGPITRHYYTCNTPIGKAGWITASATAGRQVTMTVNDTEPVGGYKIAVGDIMRDTASGAVFVVTNVNRTGPGTQAVVTVKAQTGWKTASSVDSLLIAFDRTAGNFEWFTNSRFIHSLALIGDYTAGSPVIANVRCIDGAPVTSHGVSGVSAVLAIDDYLLDPISLDNYIHEMPFPVDLGPVRITAVLDAGPSITVSRNPNVTGTFPIYNSKATDQ